jgi:hypothetical protein
MKRELNPVVGGVILVVLLVGIVVWFYSQSGGKTFSKSEARGDFGIKVDMSKVQGSGQ